MSSKSRKQRIRKIKKQSAYPVGHEVAFFDIQPEVGELFIAVYKVAVHHTGRFLCWRLDRRDPIPKQYEGRWWQLTKEDLPTRFREWGYHYMHVRQNGRVPTLEQEVLGLLKSL